MINIQTVFLNADVEEDIFVTMPPGYEIVNNSEYLWS